MHGSSETMDEFGHPGRSCLRGHTSEVLLHLWKKEREPMNGAFGFSIKEQRSPQETHAVCNAKAHSLVGKAKLLAVKL